jgi:hypothetical protein
LSIKAKQTVVKGLVEVFLEHKLDFFYDFVIIALGWEAFENELRK